MLQISSIVSRLAALLAIPLASCVSMAGNQEPLKLDVFTSGTAGYGVTSTLIYGERDAILIDAQFTNSDARKLADRIDTLGRRVTTIFITHPDADHFIGLALLHERYPQARIYMTGPALAAFEDAAAKAIADYKKTSRADEAPDAEPTPELLPAGHLVLEGRRIEIISDRQGDFADAAANSAVWIPSLRALIAGDLAFDEVHLWLDKSDEKKRAAWRAAMDEFQKLDPAIVVAGHKRVADAPDSPAVLARTRGYLETFDRLRAANGDEKAFIEAMKQAYPDWAQSIFLQIAAKSVYAAS